MQRHIFFILLVSLWRFEGVRGNLTRKRFCQYIVRTKSVLANSKNKPIFHGIGHKLWATIIFTKWNNQFIKKIFIMTKSFVKKLFAFFIETIYNIIIVFSLFFRFVATWKRGDREWKIYPLWLSSRGLSIWQKGHTLPNGEKRTVRKSTNIRETFIWNKAKKNQCQKLPNLTMIKK